MPIVVDTGAIFGMLDRRDQWHVPADRLFRDLPKPLLTCEPVLVETCFLLYDVGLDSGRALGMIADGLITLQFQLLPEVPSVMRLMEKYNSVPMSLADACLVRMSEIFDAPVFTFDTDFRIYRRNRRNLIPLIGIDN